MPLRTLLDERGNTTIDPVKVAMVGAYLKEAFPGCPVLDAEGWERDCQFYRIEMPGGGAMKHRVRVAREFFDDHTSEEIVNKLNEWNLRGVLRRAGARAVLVAEGGPQIAGAR